MLFPSPSIILSILYALPFALGAPADTPATTTLLPVTQASSSTFPLQTPITRYYSSVGRRGDGESDDTANIRPMNSEPSLTVTDFVPAPTGSDGEAQHCTFSNDYVHCGKHTPVRPGVGPDGSYFDEGGRKEVWIAGMVVGVVIAVVGAIVM
ncbi:hypothetical protein V498_08126 [Pseudogymnoascus sp. VKM F-4517 (FW-2822)]|nr:hypothetical protein V498_08126 [Pseudogymnoascus sp. VKM F-4517 (FW-2822)]